jgi:hypothetical protein
MLLLLVDPTAPVNRALDRTQNRAEEGPLTIEDARHIPAERPGDEDHNRAE